MKDQFDLKQGDQLERAIVALRQTPVPSVPSDGDIDEVITALENAVSQSNIRNSTYRSRTMKSIARISVAALCLLVIVSVVAWNNMTNNGTNVVMADLIAQVKNAKSITWKTTFYNRVTSKDGKRTWIETVTAEMAYLESGYYRDSRYDKEGNLRWAIIDDAVNRKRLTLDPKKKHAVIKINAFDWFDSNGPFKWVGKIEDNSSLEFIGHRKTKKGNVNVFRVHSSMPDKTPWSYEFWLDAKTKKLVRLRSPVINNTYADLSEKNATRQNNAEETFSFKESLGYELIDIVYNAKIDRSLFSLIPPEGYTVERKERPTVTEEEMIEFLGALARFNGGIFPDDYRGMAGTSDAFNVAAFKDEKNRTEAEQKLIDLHGKYVMAGLNMLPVMHFIEDKIVKDSFQYIGSKVAIGNAERIVCWYKLKATGKYRAVYADLSVKDVSLEELPLNVSP